MKYKVTHIHTDPKFTHNTRMFEGPYFENTQIIINKKAKEGTQGKGDSRQWTTSSSDLESIIEICSKSDLVVLYDLDGIKVKIALALPKDIKIAWRFFGYELYGKRPGIFKSEKSRKYEVQPFVKKVRLNLSILYRFLNGEKTHAERFSDAINRINYFLALSDEEYTVLKRYWPELPQFIKLPHFHLGNLEIQKDFTIKAKDKPIIIIGNNRSSYNNHLDVIEIIEKYESKNAYEFALLLSYGPQNRYTKEVSIRTCSKPYYTIIDEFMSREAFHSFYQRASCLIINGYRQMAGANIRTALAHGVKIYLNTKNVHKQFLENQGFIIFSIENFESDLANNTLGYCPDSAEHNLKIYKQFCKDYTQEDFQKHILNNLI